MIRIGIIGDYNERILAHRAIAAALPLAARDLNIEVRSQWLHTAALASGGFGSLEMLDGLWCVPGSPYASTDAALQAIRIARERPLPFLGTCGGFQHALLEYAQNVWHLPETAHEETEPDATDPVIARLQCSLVEVTAPLDLIPGTRLATIYGTTHIVEGYHCNYGLNPDHAFRFASGPLAISARDSAGEVRAVELNDHPFYIATLFQPERAALQARTPPLVKAFIKACGVR